MESDGGDRRGSAAGGLPEPGPARSTDEPAGGGVLSPDALRRLRLGEGRAEDAFLPAPPASLPVVTSVGTYSRVKGGATSFGPAGRLAATGIIALLLIAAYAWCRNAILVLLFTPVVVVLLREIWHQERLAPSIVVEDHGIDQRISLPERPIG